MSAWHRKIQAHSAGVKCPKTRAQMSGYGATSASSRKIKVTMREHEGGDKLQRNCCFLFALVVGALAAAFVAHGQRETSLSLEWTETDVVAVKAGNRIHYDDDIADPRPGGPGSWLHLSDSLSKLRRNMASTKILS